MKHLFLIFLLMGCEQVGNNYGSDDLSDISIEQMNIEINQTIDQVFIDCGARSIVKREPLDHDLTVECFYQIEFMRCEKENELDRNKEIVIPEECIAPLYGQ